MKAGKYNVKELFVNRYVQQIIIPEIQRDYVWSEKQVIGLLDSIITDYNKFKVAVAPSISTSDLELTNAFEEFYKRRNFSSNIGFIYAYNDEQYSGKYFLIDGQQRITTIYLILLVLATKNQELKNKFTSTYLLNENLKLDYKVREASHNFLNDFLKAVLNGVTDFKNQNWYYTNLYESDSTIKNWLNNFDIISSYADNNLKPEIFDFYDYLENQIDFWYFDTNISQQGEELYIYMNARGEQMQSNENIKAELLGQLDTTEEKNRYGKLWEDWQDFFWKHRGKNENADFGFNLFLNWCKILLSLEKRMNVKSDFTTDEIELYADYIRGKRKTNLELMSISIEEIEEYFNVVSFYFEKYPLSLNFSKIYGSLVENKWLRSNVSQIESFRLFPVLFFVKKHKLHKNNIYNFNEFTKLNRFLYNLRQDETIAKTAATQVIYTIRFIDELNTDFLFDELLVFESKYKSLFNDEEIIKIETLNAIEDDSVKEGLRVDFGLLEDHSLFKGKISHIIEVAKNINKGVFCNKIFSKLSKKYCELLDNSQLIKSEIIPLDSYTQIGNRIKLNDDWFKNNQIMNLLSDFYLNDCSVDLFFENRRKDFISKYENIEILKGENNSKKQLYIYYLLSINNNIKWDLTKGKNFGIYYNDIPKLDSLFIKHNYFQHYENQWHDNTWRIIDIQKNMISDEMLIEFMEMYKN